MVWIMTKCSDCSCVTSGRITPSVSITPIGLALTIMGILPIASVAQPNTKGTVVDTLTLKRIVAILNCRADFGSEATLNAIEHCLLDTDTVVCDDQDRLDVVQQGK